MYKCVLRQFFFIFEQSDNITTAFFVKKAVILSVSLCLTFYEKIKQSR